MEALRFDLSKPGNPIKLLNCTNGGPWHSRAAKLHVRSTLKDYKAARIPYSRNHDSALQTTHHGPYAHDIAMIFPNFDADENSPSSYDFASTDEDLIIVDMANARTFYRLGQSIENNPTKRYTKPPKDFAKWARICEHVIRHYTEGWADGFTYDMPYWEIWNEPDLDPEDTPVEKRRTWGGSRELFFDFFETAAKHLKSCFPYLKIGGPALACDHEDWADAFLAEMQKRSVPLDFFSWHIYTNAVENMIGKAERLRAMLDKYGYQNTEIIVNEWNYKAFGFGRSPHTIMSIHGNKGASFMMAVESAAQKAPIDMLMYYDTRRSTFNGIFDFYTVQPLKGYYAFNWFGKFYDTQGDIPAENGIENVYTLCGLKEDGKVQAVITYYSDDDSLPFKDIQLDFGRSGKFEAFIVDDFRQAEPVSFEDNVIRLKVNSFALIREI